MKNLTRYSCATVNDYGIERTLMIPTDSGEYVKFSDIRGLLKTSHNRQSTQCKHERTIEFYRPGRPNKYLWCVECRDLV